MEDRLKKALKPFPGAFNEFSCRTEELGNSKTVATMWDYITIE